MAIAWLLLAATLAPLWSQESAMEKRWREQSLDGTKAFELDNKKFQATSSVATKSFVSSQSGLLKEFKTDKFSTKAFGDKKDADLAKQLFKTDKARLAETKFATPGASLGDKKFASKEFSASQKNVADSAKTAPTRQINPEGTADGYWKAFKEKLNQDLSTEEVRELLNKPK